MRPPYNNNNNNNNRTTLLFETFFQGWLLRQQNYLDQLLIIISSSAKTHNNLQTKPTENELRTLVSQVLTHYQQYYAAKATVTRANGNVFLMFAPPWFSSFEHTLLWITGFKPGLAFKLLNSSVDQDDLSDEQLERVRSLTMETREAERDLNNELARVQESLAAPPIVDLARMTQGRRVNGEIGGDVDAAIQTLREAMEALVENADLVRMTTARKVVEILSPIQAVRFLAAATQLQVKIRMWGWKREAARGGGGASSLAN
ncbi:Transcription factor TGA like domain [Macleaya cordata]|uniref:Transcription factor TGA like domain n=1 Tax=Macleaya cordata TaxID=56857 RepID=A0A200PX24_MACCD|nr:Transcription factor TGA like domain [Macleaya cordata]